MARRMPVRSGSFSKTYVPPGDCVVVLRAIPPHLYATPHLEVWKRPQSLQERQRTASCLSAEVQAGAAGEEPVVDGAEKWPAAAEIGQFGPASRRGGQRKRVPSDVDEIVFREMAMDALEERMANSKAG